MCTITAHHGAITVPSARTWTVAMVTATAHYTWLQARSLYHLCTITAPSLFHHCTITAPSLHLLVIIQLNQVDSLQWMVQRWCSDGAVMVL